MRRPKIVKQIKDVLSTIIPDAKVILYGSEARGEATSESDIDLLILVNEDKLIPAKEKAIKEVLCDIELETNVIISSIIMPRKRWEDRPFKTPFYVNVVNEGVTL